jgi:peptidoglycan lytic transglycosylase G
MKRVLACIVALVLLVAGGTYWAWRDLQTPASLPAGGAVVSVAPGEPFGVTSARLYGAGVVRHPRLLRLWARWQGLDRLVRSGEYRFEQPLAPLDVLARLRSPAAALHRITIPEGSTLRQVAELLAAAGFGGADQFLCLARDPEFLVELDAPASGLEGYLFPDTYAFAWSTPPAEILRTMVSQFRNHAVALRARRIAAGMSEQEMVTLASLIEKETGAARERALVSAVFHNRLRAGMLLQSDPTAVYGHENGGPPTAADLTTDRPYNTYRYPGLPPGPICNPGELALEAALAPADVPYFYFVSRNDGTHEFSTTLDQHNRAVTRFRHPSARGAGP